MMPIEPYKEKTIWQKAFDHLYDLLPVFAVWAVLTGILMVAFLLLCRFDIYHIERECPYAKFLAQHKSENKD